MANPRPELGAIPVEGGTRFRVWSPTARSVAVRLFAAPDRPLRTESLARASGGQDGSFERTLPEVSAGALYKFVVDGRELPDPYGRFFPFGVHGPARSRAEAFASRGRDADVRRAAARQLGHLRDSRRSVHPPRDLGSRVHQARRAGRPRRERGRGHAGRGVPGDARVGLRRRRALRPFCQLREARTTSAPSSPPVTSGASP